ncbi:ABC-type transport system, involved in lipoprotein release, permease component [Natronincola peptidivorans]|uniref:ABC-type transport system, involved in lipoprotein release, permease component n=1 Tax=Natronincola peptidivorans TaxID=426128 RepID=A0A1I0AX36_9FIRM|nr:FtsX-like permease family protein [Natronincola peptidivorans]SES98792.1 ABC-type transport system, involved in lipoprotein release, permease component [Natronincola peptidivorans]
MQLYHIAINNLRRRKAKMFFVLLGLMIGIATIVSIYGVVEAMKTEMTRQVTEFGVNVVIKPDAGGLTFSYGGITLPEIMYDVEQLTTDDVEAIEELPSRDMIRVMAPKLIGLKDHGQHKVIVVGANLQEEFLVKPWLRIREGGKKNQRTTRSEESALETELTEKTLENEEKKMDFEMIDLTRQELDSLNLLDNQIVMGSAVAGTIGVTEGDQLILSGKGMVVYGILMEIGSVEDQQIFMNLSMAQELLDRPEEITVIEMAVDYFAGSEEALLSEMNEVLPHALITSLRQETLRRDEMLTRLVRFGIAISILVLLVGILVVGLTMSASVRERTREIGIFGALGFRKADIVKIIITEGILISMAGGLMGFFGGTAMARYVGPYVSGMDIQMPWRADLLLLAIGAAVIIGLVSSVYPAYQAAKQDPVEALRFI